MFLLCMSVDVGECWWCRIVAGDVM